MPLTNDDLEQIATVHRLGKPLADESIERLIAQAKEANRLRGELQMALLKPTTPPFGGNVEHAYEAYAEMRKERDAFATLNVTLRAALKECIEMAQADTGGIYGRTGRTWGGVSWAERLGQLHAISEGKP